MKGEKQSGGGSNFCRLKKMHNPKTENYALFGRLSEDLSPEDSLRYLWGTALRRLGTSQGIEEFLQQKSGSQNI